MIIISSINKIPTLAIIFLLVSSLVALDITRRYLSGDFATDDVELEVLYSSEKAGWLQSIATEFEDYWMNDNPNQKLRLTMTPIGTAKGTIQIAQGASEPTIWSPASSFWLPYLNTLVEEAGEPPVVDINSSPSLVVSPTIIATWQNYQKDNNITSMDDLHELALNDPEFTFAHTDPFASNGGFTGVIMQVAASANKPPEELTLQDLQSDKVYNWMRELQRRAVHYGSSTGFLAKFMASEGPDALKVSIIYENLVVEKNKELNYRIEQGEIPSSRKLVAVYPDEGVLLNDHPFAILDRPWVSNQEREIARDFINFLLDEERQERAVEYGFRPVIEVDASVLEEEFNEENGVLRSLDELNIYNTSNMDGTVVQRIPDVWSATRSRSLGDTQSGLTRRDFFVPIAFSAVILLMTLNPIIKMVKRRLY